MELVAVHGVGGEEGLRFARLRGSAGVPGGRSTEQEKTFHFLPFTFYLLPFPLTFSEAIRPGINEHK
jgi:hypothetical protein